MARPTGVERADVIGIRSRSKAPTSTWPVERKQVLGPPGETGGSPPRTIGNGAPLPADPWQGSTRLSVCEQAAMPGMDEGPNSATGEWPKLFDEWAAAVLAAAETPPPAIFREAASEEAIGTLEHRLGTRLPTSYRAFLAHTDGADAFPGWGIVRWGSSTEASTGLHPTTSGRLAPGRRPRAGRLGRRCRAPGRLRRLEPSELRPPRR